MDFLKWKLNKLEPHEQIDNIVSDFVQVSDSELAGYIVRSGAYEYRDPYTNELTIKYKDGENLKEVYTNLDHAIAMGSRQADSHVERDDRMIGYFDTFEYVPKGEIGKYGEKDIDPKHDRIHAVLHTKEDIEKISDLKEFNALPVSASYDDLGYADKQIVGKVHHIAVSLNKNERDRCSTAGGSSCNVSLRNDFITSNIEAHDHTDEVILTESDDINNGVSSADTTPVMEGSQPPTNKNESEGTMGKNKEKDMDKKEDETEDEMEEKEEDMNNNIPHPTPKAQEEQLMHNQGTPDFEAQIQAEIKKRVDLITKQFEEQMIQKQKDMEDAKEANDLKELLITPAYGGSLEQVKDMSLDQLKSTKAYIESTKYFQDFQRAQEPSSQDINKQIFTKEVSDYVNAGKDPWSGIKACDFMKDAIAKGRITQDFLFEK